MKKLATSDSDLPPPFRKPQEERLPLEQIPLHLPYEEEIPLPPPPPNAGKESEIDPFLRRGPELTQRRGSADR